MYQEIIGTLLLIIIEDNFSLIFKDNSKNISFSVLSLSNLSVIPSKSTNSASSQDTFKKFISST
jgi:hypothetical protein